MAQPATSFVDPSRRELLALSLGAAAFATLPLPSAAAQSPSQSTERNASMENRITTEDGVDIYFKDWGPKDRQPIVFHHGWPLSSDDWDNQMLFLLANGYRVVAHDRRGHGRSTQVSEGNDMDHYAADAAAVVEHLDLRNAVHIGHSTGGGEVARYVARFGQPQGRVAKAILVSSVPPLMVKTKDNPAAAHRSRSSTDTASRSRQIAHNSTSTWRQTLSTDSIGRVRRSRRASSKTGGGRAWRAERNRTTRA